MPFDVEQPKGPIDRAAQRLMIASVDDNSR
jgi:hypothetical protein